MKKNITISFVIATVVFCILLYYFLFLTDHNASKLSIAFLVTAIIATGVAIIWLFNKYIKLPLQKGTQEKKSAGLNL